jgi:hypothetical protein
MAVLSWEVGTKAATGVHKTNRSVGQRNKKKKLKEYYKVKSIYRPGQGHIAPGV